jgi:hypothetical protein
MPLEDTNSSLRHYQVDPEVADKLCRDTSDLARAGGANEHDFHSSVFNYPELVTYYLGEEQPVAWRKEITSSKDDRMDLFVLFHGQSRCDLIECKGPSRPIIGEHATTPELEKSLRQLARYRDAFKNRTLQDSRLHLYTENQPRLVLIGDAKRQKPTPDVAKQAELLKEALQGNPLWNRDYDSELLIVMTWDMLVKRAKEAPQVATSRWCNNVVKRVLGNIAWDKDRQRTSLPSLDEFMYRASGVRGFRDSRTLVEARAAVVIDKLRQLQVSHDKELDTQLFDGQLQLADWLLYENDGDMPCIQWDHASTYGAKDILAEIPSVWTVLIGHLLKALAKDSSDDVLGRTSHVLRYASEHAKKLLVDDRTLRHKWKFPDPEELATEPLRPALVNFIQIGYCLAHHGAEEAVVFMNQAAATPHVVNDLAVWNTLHAKQDPAKLMGSLRQKAEAPTENQRPFLPWHKAIFEATESLFQQLPKLQQYP